MNTDRHIQRVAQYSSYYIALLMCVCIGIAWPSAVRGELVPAGGGGNGDGGACEAAEDDEPPSLLPFAIPCNGCGSELAEFGPMQPTQKNTTNSGGGGILHSDNAGGGAVFPSSGGGGLTPGPDRIIAPPGGMGGVVPGSPQQFGSADYQDAFWGGASDAIFTRRPGYEQIGLRGDPVIAETGENIFKTNDMTVVHDGTFMSVTRIYRHLTDNPVGSADFGENFHSNLYIAATEQSSTEVDVDLGTGHIITFNDTAGNWSAGSGYERYDFDKIDLGSGEYRYELTDNNGYKWVFEEENATTSSPYKLDYTENRFGEGQQYNYTAGLLSSIECNYKMTISVVRNGYDQITQISDSLGRQVNYTYESLGGRLLTVSDACGCGASLSIRYVYDGSTGFMEEIYNGADDLVRTIYYDGTTDMVEEIEDYQGNSWLFDYDISTTTITDASGYEHEYTFDADGNITQVVHDVSLSPLTTVTFGYSYDSSYNLTEIDMPTGYDILFEYDDRNRLYLQEWEDGQPSPKTSTEKTLDSSDGKVTKLTDPMDVETSFTFSGQQLTAVDLPGTSNDRVLSYTATTVRDWFPTQITDATSKVTKASIEYEADYIEIIANQEITGSVDTTDSIVRYDYAGRRIYSKPADTAATSITYSDVGLVMATTTDGITTEFTYDSNGKVATRTIKDGAVTKESWTYDHDRLGRLLSIENDKVGGETTYTYDERGLVSIKTDPAGLQTKYTYDGLGRTTRVQQGDGTTWRNVQIISYDAMGRITSVLDGEEKETAREYDSYGRLESVIDHDDDYTTYTYDDADRVTEVERYDSSDNLLERTVTTYDTNRGWPTLVRRYADADGSASDANDARTSMTYDDEGRITSRKVYYSSTGYNETTYTYDGVGRMATMTDPEGNVTTYGYDDAGRRTSVTNAASQVTTTEYDAEGHVKKVTQDDGTYTEYLYDHAGRQTSMITKSASNVALSKTTTSFNEIGQVIKTRRWDDPTSSTPNDTYDHVTTNTYGTTTNTGRLISTTNASGETTTYAYDSTYGYRTVVTLPDGGTTTYSDFDGNGKAKTVTRVEKTTGQSDKTFVTKYTFDNLGRVATITNQGADGTIGNGDDEVITYTYDERGNRVGVLDASGMLTTTEFDDLGRKVEVIEDDSYTGYTGIARVTEFEYDNAGRMTKLIAYTDSPSTGLQETIYTYDGNGRQVAVTYEVTGTVGMEYDSVGNMTERSDEAGVCVDYTYDSDTNRLTERKECNATTDIETFTYDDLGRILTAQKGTSANPDAISKSTFTYDDLGRVLTEAQSIREGTAKTITYVYDKAGNRTKVTYPDGTVLDFEYDSRDRVQYIDVDTVQMAEYWWRGNAPFAKEITTDYPGATDPVMRTDFVRDHLMRVTQLTTGHLTSNQADTGYDDILTINYTYDTASNPLTAVDNDTTWNAVSNSFDYDTLNRLVQADLEDTQTWTAASTAKQIFAYDDLGNRTSLSDGKVGSSIDDATYTHDAANRTTSVTPGAFFGGLDADQTYDAAGNLTETAEIYSGKGYDLEYDHHNRLIAVKNRAGTETLQTFEHDALGRMIESVDLVNDRTTRYYYDGVNVVNEYDENDNHLRYYVKGPSFVDELLVMMDVYTDRPYYYVLDRMYSVRKLVDRAGAIVESVAYDAYGLARLRLSAGRGDFDLDGDVDSSDVTYHASVVSGSKWNPVGDIDDDGDVDATDAALIADREEPWDGDGNQDVIVAASFSRTGNPYFFQGRQRFSNDTAENELDGTALDSFTISADMDGDYAVVGAFRHDEAATDAGLAYVYKFNGSDWVIDARLTADDAAATDLFGYGVAIDGNTVVVGSPGDDDDGSFSGSAYVFVRDANGWSQQAKLTAGGSYANAAMGRSIAIKGDVVAVGAPYYNDGSDDVGAVNVFRRSGTSWSHEQLITASDKADGDLFGERVSIDTDRLLVGAAQHTVSGDADAGQAYVFDYNSGTSNWDETKILTASDSDASFVFGLFVSLSGSRVAVGALGADDDGGPTSDTGAVYIFEEDEGGTDNWGQVIKINSGDADTNDGFGQVSLDGTRLAVGAFGDGGAGAYAGAVYVFEKDEGGTDNWGQVIKKTASDAAGGDSLGYTAVCLDDDVMLAGSPFDTEQGTSSGSAYFFDKDLGGTDNWGEDQKIVAIAPLQPAMPTYALNYHRARFMDPVQGTWVTRDPLFNNWFALNTVSILPSIDTIMRRDRKFDLFPSRFFLQRSKESLDLYYFNKSSPLDMNDPSGLSGASPKQWKRCCKRAISQFPGAAGLMVCCCGEKRSCAYPQNVIPPIQDSLGEDIVVQCIREHECTHKDDIDCGPNSRLVPQFTDQSRRNVEYQECVGLWAEKRCLETWRVRCRTQACRDDIDNRLRSVNIWIRGEDKYNPQYNCRGHEPSITTGCSGPH